MIIQARPITRHLRPLALGIAFCISLCIVTFATGPAGAAAQQASLQQADRIVAIVNDEPISEFDITQRINLMRALGALKGAKEEEAHKEILELLVNEHLQRQEAKRYKVQVKPKDVTTALGRMAKRVNSDPESLAKTLKSKGASLETLRAQIAASIAWQRIVRSRFSAALKVADAEVNRRYKQELAKPRPSKQFFVLKQIVLPLDKNAPEPLIRARLAEAQTIMQRFKGCASTGKAVQGIFGAQVRDIGTVPAERLPQRLRKGLAKLGPGRIAPPGRSAAGLEMIAYCGNKTVEAPEITRDAVQSQIQSEQIGVLEQRYLRDLRRDAVVEYR